MDSVDATIHVTDKVDSRIYAEDSVILFADLQSGIVELTQTNPLKRLRAGVLALSKLAKLFAIPAIVCGIRGEDGGDARVLPEIESGVGSVPTLDRTTWDSFRNSEIVSAIKATKRKTLLISGVATELAVQLPALTATDEGYSVYVVLDACGGMSERTEQAALLRLASVGATTVSVMALAGELAGDFSEPSAQAAIGIVYEMANSVK